MGDDFRGQGDPVRTAWDRLQAFQFAILAPLVDGANADVEQSGRRFGGVAPVAARLIFSWIGHFGTTGRDLIFQSHPAHADPIEFPTGSGGQSFVIKLCGNLVVGLMGGERANGSNDFVWSAPDFIDPLATGDGMFTHGTRLRYERPVGSLHLFRLGMLTFRCPYLPHYRIAFACSDILYPLSYRLTSRFAFPIGRTSGLPRSA